MTAVMLHHTEPEVWDPDFNPCAGLPPCPSCDSSAAVTAGADGFACTACGESV